MTYEDMMREAGRRVITGALTAALIAAQTPCALACAEADADARGPVGVVPLSGAGEAERGSGPEGDGAEGRSKEGSSASDGGDAPEADAIPPRLMEVHVAGKDAQGTDDSVTLSQGGVTYTNLVELELSALVDEQQLARDERTCLAYAASDELRGSTYGSSWESRGSTNVATCILPAIDACYSISVNAVDEAGNVLAGEGETTVGEEGFHSTLVVDHVAPALVAGKDDETPTIVWDGPGREVAQACFDDARHATITIREELSWGDALTQADAPVKVRVTRDGKDVDVAAWYAVDGEQGYYRCELELSEEGTYVVEVVGSDRAGNAMSFGSDEEDRPLSGYVETFTIDRQAPTISVELAQNETAAVSIDGVPCYGSDVPLMVRVEDLTIDDPATQVELRIDGNAVDGLSWETVPRDGSKPAIHTTTYVYAEAGLHHLPVVIARDRAGHVSRFGDEDARSFLIDRSATVVTSVQMDQGPLVRQQAAEVCWFFRHSATMTLRLTDNVGIANVDVLDDRGAYGTDYQPDDDGRGGTLALALRDPREPLGRAADFDRRVHVRVRDLVGNERIWSLAPEGVVTTDEDAANTPVGAGSVVGHPSVLVLDTAAPELFLETNVEEGGHYASHDEMLHLVVREENLDYLQRFDPEQELMRIAWRPAEDGSSYRDEDATVVRVSDLVRDEQAPGTIVYSYTYAFDRDGHYCVSPVSLTDIGAHQAAVDGIGEFSVDTLAPAITVAWDNVDVRRDGAVAYYDDDRKATITVVEHNFDPALLAIETNGSPGRWSTVGDVHTIEVSFSTDADDCYLDVSGSDVAGNIAKPYRSEHFVLDKTSPEIFVEYLQTGQDGSSEPVREVDGVAYCDHSRFVLVTVRERHFDPHDFAIEVETSDCAIDAGVRADDASAWQELSGDRHRYLVACDREATYRIQVSGKDKAGHSAVSCTAGGVWREGYASPTFVVDLTAPEVTSEFARMVDYAVLDNKRYYAHPVQISCAVRDRHLDTSSLFVVDAYGTELSFEEAQWEVSGPDDQGLYTYTTTLTYPEGERLTPQLRVRDLSAHQASLSPQSFVVDMTAPTISGVALVDERGQRTRPVREGRSVATDDPIQFFHAPTRLVFSFADEHLIDHVALYDPDGTYAIDEQASGVQRGSADAVLTLSLVDGSRAEHDAELERREGHLVYVCVTDIAGNSRTWSLDRNGTVVDARESSSLNAALNDEGVFPIALVLDMTAPRVVLSGVESGVYYNSPQTVHALVSELNYDYLARFDPTRVVLSIRKREGSAGREESMWMVGAASFVGGREGYGFVQTFEDDGHYTVTAQLRDYAENSSNVASIDEFTIDRTAPVISVAWDNDEVRNGDYYGASRTATITVREHNFEAGLFDIDTTGSVGSWITEGDTHTCTVFFGETGRGERHHLTVSGKDLAGNVAEAVTVAPFVVDVTSPTVEIGGAGQRLGSQGAVVQPLTDHSAYNGIVMPTITYRDDANLDGASCSYTLVSNKHGEVSKHFDVVRSDPIDNTLTVSFADLGYEGAGDRFDALRGETYVDDYAVDVDDIYTLSAEVSDLAGHTAEATLHFSVNRYGSNYLVEVIDAAGVDRGSYEGFAIVAEAPTVVVREINVSGSDPATARRVEKEHANVTSVLDLVTTPLGAGYQLEELSDDEAPYGWTEYVYTIHRANFGQGSSSDHGDGGQGLYRVNVVSDDTASNANTTAAYWASDAGRTRARLDRATEDFILDQLGPVIDQLDVPTSLAVGTAYEASFHLTDDITLGDDVEVRVDGAPVTVREGGTSDEGAQRSAMGLAKGTGTYCFTIPAKSFAQRRVEIRVRDYAGREVSVERGGFWTTTLVRESLLLALVPAGIAGLLWMRRRMRDAAEPDVPSSDYDEREV